MVYLGIDIGGMSIKGAAVTSEGKVSSNFSMPFSNSDPSEVTLTRLAKNIKEYIATLPDKDVKGIGIGCPGAIDSVNGIVNYANNLKWNDVHLKEELEKMTGLPVRITNDANAATLGEVKFGVGKIYKNAIMLTLGTGVGGGIIINGKLYEGNEGKGAELGHSVICVDGEQCTCGRKGCLEAYASASAIIRQTKKMMKENKSSLLWELAGADIDKVNGKLTFDAAKNGDKTALEVVGWYVKYLGEGILNFCNIFRPDIVILSGGIANQGDYLINKLVAYCAERNYGYPRAPKVEIAKAILGYESGMIGAAALFME